MVLIWHLLTINSHEEPLADAFHVLILMISDLIFDELFASQHLELGQIVLLQDLVDFGPKFLLCWVQLFFFIR